MHKLQGEINLLDTLTSHRFEDQALQTVAPPAAPTKHEDYMARDSTTGELDA